MTTKTEREPEPDIRETPRRAVTMAETRRRLEDRIERPWMRYRPGEDYWA